MFRQFLPVLNSPTPPVPSENLLDLGITPVDCLKKIPEYELYRLMVDGCLHKSEYGWLGYANREHGSLDALYRALEIAFTNLNECVSVGLIQKIHKACSSQNNEEMVVGFFNLAPGNFRENMGGYYLFNYEQNGRNNFLSEQGFYEFHDMFLAKYQQYGARISEIDQAKLRTAHVEANIPASKKTKEELWSIIQANQALYYRAPEQRYLNYLIRWNCEKYNKAIALAETEDSKLRVIIQFVKDIELIHAFQDFNGRTSLALLQRLLIQQNFLPVMLYDPNYIDGHSIDELVDDIKNGMQNTRLLIEDPMHSLFAYCSLDINTQINKLLNNPKTYRALANHACRSPELMADSDCVPSYFAGALYASRQQRYCLISPPKFNALDYKQKLSMMNGLYVRVNEELYFVSSDNVEGVKIELTPEALAEFDERLKSTSQYQVLSDEDLKRIEAICQHGVECKNSGRKLYDVIQAMGDVLDVELIPTSSADSPRPF